MLSSTNLKPFIPQQKHFSPSFKGEKDIVIIDDSLFESATTEHYIKEAVGNGYNIHTALGGKAGLVAVDKYKPKLTVTAFCMKGYRPDGTALLNELKKMGTHIIVFTKNWYGQGELSRKFGVQNCEVLCGADKYVSQWDTTMFVDSVKAILNDKEPPRYRFQKHYLKDLINKIKGIISHNN